jgi:hypothetical protein
MVSRLVSRATTALVAMHSLVWAVVVVVWFFAWRVEPAPMGPPFDFAKRFLSRIDMLVSSPLDAVSVTAALRTAKWLGTDLGLTYAVLFGCLILLAGTLQWFLLGKLVQRVMARSGRTPAIAVLGLYGLWVGGATFLWVAS